MHRMQNPRRNQGKTTRVNPALKRYRGRFAPTPSGGLHMGSLITALGSYLDAKAHCGDWLLRIENIDSLRCKPGITGHICQTLEEHGLLWDGTILFQSDRIPAYQEALQQLEQLDITYLCSCTRRETILSKQRKGTCKCKLHGPDPNRSHRATKISISNKLPPSRGGLYDNHENFLLKQWNDPIIKRKDGCYSYHLAVVVDDAFQGITNVVRGSDLCSATLIHQYLQQALKLPSPHYMHLPLLKNKYGTKLSKQNHAPILDNRKPTGNLWRALAFLHQDPPRELLQATPMDVLAWAINHWNPLNASARYATTYHCAE